MRLVLPPANGFWRVGRAPDPLVVGPALTSGELDDANVGNRFDSARGDFRVVYFGTNLTTCYGETLARFRPDPVIVKVLEEDDEDHFMRPGEIPADWRIRRVAVRARPVASPTFPDEPRFLDVEALETREALRKELGSILAYYGYDDLDVSVVRGSDRRITRWISSFAHEVDPAIAGIRYLSRLSSDWECWAVFDNVDLEQLETQPILRTDAELTNVAKTYGLTIF